MNYKKLAILVVLFAVLSCQKETIEPVSQKLTDTSTESFNSDLKFKNGSNKGKGRKDDTDNDDTPDPISYASTYKLSSQNATHPLYQFSISTSGDLMLLQTDSTITTWGTDYWGFWSEPFGYSNNKINYISGLTNVTYEFEMLANDQIAVKQTLIVQPWPTGQPTTTISYPGIYDKVD